MILDFLYKNKFEKDVTNAMVYLIETTLKSCSYNPKAFGLPIVSFIFVKCLKC